MAAPVEHALSRQLYSPAGRLAVGPHHPHYDSGETASAGVMPNNGALGVPMHVAIIMDGNGRWAQARGQRRHSGHRAGSENIRRVIERFCQRGVRYVTLFAFSTENWGRPRREIDGLLRLSRYFLGREVKQLHANGVRLRHLGHLEELDPDLQRQVLDAIELTKNNARLTLSVAFNYGGRREIVDAVKQIVAAGIAPDEVDEPMITAHLNTAGLPDPDLVIRTAGEMRLSNFLLWQAAYAEYYSTPTYWPDFGCEEVDAALAAFAARNRRFGLVQTAPEPTNRQHRLQACSAHQDAAHD